MIMNHQFLTIRNSHPGFVYIWSNAGTILFTFYSI